MENDATLPDASAGPLDGVPSIPDIFGSVVDLVTAGANGLAAIIFVSVMIVMVFSLILGTRMTREMVGLTKWYLVVGAVCVVVSLAGSFTDRYFRAAYDLHVSISPSLRTAGLPDPVIRADTMLVNLNEVFPVNDNIGITVMIDEIISAIRTRDEAVVATVQQANVIVEENNKLQETLTQQSVQLESVRSSFETLKAGLDTTAPSWADGQLDALALNLDAIETPIEASNFQRYDPIALPDDVLLLAPGPAM
ncbi:MAG: hypothetical protein ACK4G5_05845 [Devosia sp.]